MSEALRVIEGSGDLAGLMGRVGRDARAASRRLALASSGEKDAALRAMAAAIRAAKPRILAANGDDVAEARGLGQNPAFLDRLALDAKRGAAIAAAVGAMLAGLDGALDVLVPRGGRNLVARVQAEARVPVFAHLDGVCHVYVHAAADPAKARAIVLNAKLRRTGICSAAETLLVDRAAAPFHLQPLLAALLDGGCAVRGDLTAQATDSRVTPASEDD